MKPLTDRTCRHALKHVLSRAREREELFPYKRRERYLSFATVRFRALLDRSALTENDSRVDVEIILVDIFPF